MIFIVDGMSRAGKTTAVKKLVPRLDKLIPTESFRWRPQEMGQDVYWGSLVGELYPMAKDPLKLWIADRLHGSEYVYGLHDGKEFPFNSWMAVDSMLQDNWAFQVVCTLPTEEMYKRCAESGRALEGHPDNVRRLWTHYCEAATKVPYQIFSGQGAPGDLEEKIFMRCLKWMNERRYKTIGD